MGGFWSWASTIIITIAFRTLPLLHRLFQARLAPLSDILNDVSCPLSSYFSYWGTAGSSATCSLIPALLGRFSVTLFLFGTFSSFLGNREVGTKAGVVILEAFPSRRYASFLAFQGGKEKDYGRSSQGPCRSRVQHLGPSGAGIGRSQESRLRMLFG